MKPPTINSRILKLEVLKGTATRTSVNAVESRTTSLESDVATAQGDISTLQGDVATLTQGIQDAVSTHNTAPDSHADLRTLIGDRALSVHQHARTDLPWVTEPGSALLTSASASAQRTALGMTAWAVAPWTDGTTSDIPEGTQLYFTNARADARIAAQKGQAEGLAPLDAGGKVPTAHLPDSLVGQVIYKGLWDASTNTPTLPTASAAQGYYYITSVAGTYSGVAFDAGDWCISDGTAWGKVDNSDAITSFAGRVGAILPIASDYASFYLGISAQAADSAKLGGVAASGYSQTGHTHNYAGSSTPGGAATTALACTGNAATATKLEATRYINGIPFDGTGDVRINRLFDTDGRRFTNPSGTNFGHRAAFTGALAIRFPVGMTSTMVSMRIRVFENLEGGIYDLLVGGYTYAGGKFWTSTSASLQKSSELAKQLTVRFGYDSDNDKAMIYIGDLNTSWSDMCAYILDVQCGYTGYSMAWSENWYMFVETVSFRNITATKTC